MSRNLKISLEPVSGGLTMFYAFVDGQRVLRGSGKEKQSWEGNISDAQVRIKIRVLGIGNAKYKFVIDLPGVADDQSLNLQLEDGYHEMEVLL